MPIITYDGLSPQWSPVVLPANLLLTQEIETYGKAQQDQGRDTQNDQPFCSRTFTAPGGRFTELHSNHRGCDDSISILRNALVAGQLTLQFAVALAGKLKKRLLSAQLDEL